MADILPIFRYHPDPVETGMVVASDAACACCDRVRGCVYVGPVYAARDMRNALCPWCIADGSAAEKFDASFADPHPMIQDGLGDETVEEVCARTPGYDSWQQDCWLSHCDDACEFHGNASVADVRDASPESREDWRLRYRQGETSWSWATDGYQPGGCSALYKFVCRHCRQVLFGWDLC